MQLLNCSEVITAIFGFDRRVGRLYIVGVAWTRNIC